MSMTKSDYAPVFEDEAASWVAYCEWSEQLGGPDADPDCCAICFTDYARPRSGLCPCCEGDMTEAAERDRLEALHA